MRFYKKDKTHLFLVIRQGTITGIRLHARKKPYLDYYVSFSYDLAWPQIHSIVHLKDFFCSHPKNSFLSIILDSGVIKEQWQHSCMLEEDQPIDKRSLTGSMYLCPLADNQHLFYTFTIDHPALFQLQLIAQHFQIHLSLISSFYAMLLQTYKLVYAQAFRQSQLAIDLIRHEYNLENTIHTGMINRFLDFDSTLNMNLDAQKNTLFAIIGAYYSQKGV